MWKLEPSESLPGPSSIPVSPVPVQTTSSKKIALEASSTSNRVDTSAEDLHLIKQGSLQGAISAFSYCGSPLTITEDRKNRRGLVSNLSISCSVCGKSSAITDSYCKKDLEVNNKSVLAMRAIGKGRTALETFCGLMGMLPHSTKQAYASDNKKLYDSSLKEREASFAAAA